MANQNNDWVDVDEWQDVPQKTSLPLSPMEAFRDYINNAPLRAEQRVNQRSSIMADLIKDPTTLQRFIQHPLGTTLRTLGGAWELVEGIPADVLYNLNTPQNILPDIYKTAIGQRPIQMGDSLVKGGFPEPLAAIGGMALTGMEGTPTAALGNIAFEKPIQGLKFLLNQFGKPAVAKAMQFFTGQIPPVHAERAINNPEILNPKYLEQEGQIVKNAYSKIIQPLRDDPKAVVNLNNVMDRIEKEGWKTTLNRIPSEFYKMKDNEANLVKNWIEKIQIYVGGNTKPDFNEVEGLINKIDEALGKFYTRESKTLMTGKDLPSTNFERIASILRNELSNAIKTQYPEAATAISLAAQHALNREAANSFKGLAGSFYKSIFPRVAMIAGGLPTRGASLLAYPLTMPAAWGVATRFGVPALKGALQPPYMMPLLRKGLEKGQENDWVDVE